MRNIVSLRFSLVESNYRGTLLAILFCLLALTKLRFIFIWSAREDKN